MLYRFISFQTKVSSKGNKYGVLNVVDLNGGVFEAYVYDPLLSHIIFLNFDFGDYVDVECNLKGIVSVNLSEDK